MVNEIRSYEDREYAVACIQLHQMERAFRFLLVDKITRKITDKEVSLNDLEKFPTTLCWNRKQIEVQVGDKNPVQIVAECFDISQYDEQLASMLEEKDLCWGRTIYHIICQSLIAYVTQALLQTIPPKRPWKDKDFRDVAEFYKKDYKILDYTSIHIPEDPRRNAKRESRKTSLYYKTLRRVYSFLIGMNQEDEVDKLIAVRDQLKEQRKKRNKKDN